MQWNSSNVFRSLIIYPSKQKFHKSYQVAFILDFLYQTGSLYIVLENATLLELFQI